MIKNFLLTFFAIFLSLVLSYHPALSKEDTAQITLRKTAISKVQLATNQGFKSFVCNSKELDYEYLYYLLSVFQETLTNLVPPGTKYKEINTSTIKNFSIPIPVMDIQKKNCS